MANTGPLLQQILDLIGVGNKAQHPISTTFHQGVWWVYVDVDMPKGTFDIEVQNPSLEQALKIALKSLRKEFS